MLGVGAHVVLEVADTVAAVGHERDFLVHRHARGNQQRVQPALGFGVVTDDEAEAAGGALLGHRLADDQPEVRRSIGPAAYIAAVDADRHRRPGDRHCVPFGLAAGWAGPGTADAHRVELARLGFERGLDPDLVLPRVAEIVVIEDALVQPQREVGQADLAAISIVVALAAPHRLVEPAMQPKSMKVIVFPADGDLNVAMQPVEQVVGHEQPRQIIGEMPRSLTFSR